MKTVLIRLIRVYQALTRPGVPTPILLGAFSGCRSWPTCSDFAASAIEREGAFRGTVSAVKRFLKCNPLTPAPHT